MTSFIFPPAIQEGIRSGMYEIVQNKTTGQLIGLARDKATGRFVSLAVQTITPGEPLNPLTIQRGFTATLEGIKYIQAGLSVLQTTTAFIGLGVAVNTGLSAVNLWQTFKLREDIKQLKFQVRDGFIDLKQALHSQKQEIIQQLEFVAQDIKFEQHRLELIKAYGRFLEATKLIKMSLSCENESIINADLANARQTLSEALAIYNNPHLLSETSAAGQLRRLECAWMIEQMIILTYQLQNQTSVVAERLVHLQETMRQDCLKVLDHQSSIQEIAFLFPEINHIYDHDLVAIEAGKNQIDWINTLSPSEQQDLALMEIPTIQEDHDTMVEKPKALTEYEKLQAKSHSKALKDQVKFRFSPALRSDYEMIISQRANEEGYTALVSSNLQEASNLTIANLYWYFEEAGLKQIMQKNTIESKLEALQLSLSS